MGANKQDMITKFTGPEWKWCDGLIPCPRNPTDYVWLKKQKKKKKPFKVHKCCKAIDRYKRFLLKA